MCAFMLAFMFLFVLFLFCYLVVVYLCSWLDFSLFNHYLKHRLPACVEDLFKFVCNVSGVGFVDRHT